MDEASGPRADSGPPIHETMARSLRGIGREFVIVVVGVLVALATDSAMDDVRRRGERVEAVRALRRDVAEDLAQLDTVRIPFIEAQAESRRTLGSGAVATAPLRDSVAIVAAIESVGSYLTFDANTSAIEYLTSTGQLQLIGNERLRSAILTCYNSVEDVAEIDALYPIRRCYASWRLVPWTPSSCVPTRAFHGSMPPSEKRDCFPRSATRSSGRVHARPDPEAVGPSTVMP